MRSRSRCQYLFTEIAGRGGEAENLGFDLALLSFIVQFGDCRGLEANLQA